MERIVVNVNQTVHVVVEIKETIVDSLVVAVLFILLLMFGFIGFAVLGVIMTILIICAVIDVTYLKRKDNDRSSI